MLPKNIHLHEPRFVLMVCSATAGLSISPFRTCRWCWSILAFKVLPVSPMYFLEQSAQGISYTIPGFTESEEFSEVSKEFTLPIPFQWVCPVYSNQKSLPSIPFQWVFCVFPISLSLPSLAARLTFECITQLFEMPYLFGLRGAIWQPVWWYSLLSVYACACGPANAWVHTGLSW